MVYVGENNHNFTLLGSGVPFSAISMSQGNVAIILISLIMEGAIEINGKVV